MPKLPQYDKKLLEKALDDISKGVGIRETAKKYGIPKSSLHFNLKNPNKKADFGPNPYLTKDEEKELENWICDMGRKGFPRSKDDILDSVQAFLNANPRETPFKDNRPGRGWLKGFLKRHPNISDRKPESVSQASSCVSETDIRKWFSQISDYLNTNNLKEVLQDPSRVFNADESGFRTCPSSGRVYAEKGEKNVYIIDKGKSKESITALFCISGDGKTVLPTIVYPYQRLPDRIRQSVPPEWGLAMSPSGWMTADTFQFVIEHIFHPHLVQKNIQFPVVLFVDGHRSHLSYNLSVLASKLQIEIIALYPNSTHILQPADVSLFRPVKQLWKSAVRDYIVENEGECVNKQNFAMVLKKVVDKVNPDCVINGFRACGLYPFNPDAVDYSKCLAKKNPPEEPNVGQTKHPELSFEKFVDIVGQDIIRKFERINHIIGKENNNEEFYTLFRIWEFFECKQNADRDTADLVMNTVVNHDTDIEDPVQETTSAIRSPGQVEIQETTRGIPIDNSQAISSSAIIEPWENSTETACIGPENALSSTDILSNATPLNGSSDICANEPLNAHDELSSTAGNSLLNKSSEHIMSSAVQQIEGEELAKTFKDFLYRPAEPKRKGKRQVARLSFNISSKEYQEALEEKAREKIRVEEEKKLKKQEREDKKRKREEEKKNKIQKKIKISNINQDITNRPSTSKSADKYEKNLEIVQCDKCGRNVKENVKIKCCECTRAFHISCVPKKHAQHVPEKEDNDFFLCHICYDVTEDYSGNSDSEHDSENSNSDDSTEKLQREVKKYNKEMGLF